MKKGYQSEADFFSYDGLQACVSEGAMVHKWIPNITKGFIQ
jgi:hypothetical protein